MPTSVIFAGSADSVSVIGTRSVTLTQTPVAGDHLVLVLSIAGNTFTPTGVTGAGAAWSAPAGISATSHSHWFWVGADPNSGGVITVTNSESASRTGTLDVYIIRGIGTNPVMSAAVTATAFSTALAGPTQSAPAGSAVLGVARSKAGMTWPSSQTPVGAWTVGSNKDATQSGYATPTATANHSTSLTTPAGGASLRITQVYITGTPVSGSPATVTVPAGVASVSGTAPVVNAPDAATVTVPAGVLTLDAAAPTVTGGAAASTPATVTVPAGELALSATAPTIGTGQIDGAPWILDDSQRDLAPVRDVEPVLAIVTSPPAAIPAALSPRMVTRRSDILDPAALAPDPATGRRHAPGTHDVITEDVGYLHVWVDGIDVTYFGDAQTRIGNLTSSGPGGDGTTTLTFPTLTSLDETGAGDWSWLRPGAPVDVALVSPAGVRLAPDLFNGSLISDEPRLSTNRDVQTWAARGVFAGITQRHRAPIMMGPTDIGTVIPRALNGIVGRRFGTIASVVTGIPTTKRGTYAQTEWQYVAELLAKAWTVGGRQWTLERTATPRQYRLVLRDSSTVHWTLVEGGAYGVEVDLDSDYSETYNAVYGHGIAPAPKGWYFGNWRHPGLSLVAPPPYPFTNPATDIDVGTTDAMTDTGDGVTVWQRRMRALGYGVTIDGVYSSADEQWARKVQRDRGLHVGGGVGPQTWVATFDEGTNGADLSKSYRAPLAVAPEVEPFLYAANGAIVGGNPAYDPNVERRESDDIDFGTGVTKAEAIAEAEKMLARNAHPGWVGTITLRGDPWEGSRWFMFEGQNVLLHGHRGGDVLLHIVARNLDPETGQVTLTVDSKARDALTVREIRERNAESRIDPARKPGNANRRSRLDQDILNPFDGESGAGRFYRRPINGLAGLWSVVPVYISEAGQLNRVYLRTLAPAAKFWVALFGKEVTPNWMAARVGNPASPDAWKAVIEDRENNGLIEQWGNDSQPCGVDEAGNVNGILEDTGGLSYYSTKGGWTWVAVYADRSTFIEGAGEDLMGFYPAPIQ